jgi:AcrR family transcriptional regulator
MDKKIKMDTPSQDKTETKDRILFAAKKEFAEKGFDGARMGSIAKRACANQALLHYYFEGKDKLYEEVINRLFGLDRTKMLSDFLGKIDSLPSEKLYLIIYFMAKLHMEASDPDLHRIISREIAEDRTLIKTLIRNYFIPQLTLMEDIIQKGITSGEFEKTNPYFVILGFLSIIMFYKSNKAHYEDTEFYDKLYGGIKNVEFIEYVLKQTFRTLTPEGKTSKLPEISPDYINQIDQMIEDIKKVKMLNNKTC